MDASTSHMYRQVVQKTYLITYSQANLEKFPTRQSFANSVVEAFASESTKWRLLHWVCSMEDHQEGGKHYHMALKFNMNKRCLYAKKSLVERHGISVHFSDNHDNYYSAYRYATKSDKEAFHSDDHPNLVDARSPKTKAGTKSLRKSMAEKRLAKNSKGACPSSSGNPKRKSLSKLDVSQLLIDQNIHNDIELLSLAHTQKEEGKVDLAEFILKKTPKALNDLCALGEWKLPITPLKGKRKPEWKSLKRPSKTNALSTALEAGFLRQLQSLRTIMSTLSSLQMLCVPYYRKAGENTATS